MKMVKRIVGGIIACVSFVSSLFGCDAHHLVDGPGMVNDLTWKEFTLSRADSYAQYNFWFTVQVADNCFLLTGECRDDVHGILSLEEGVELSADDVIHLRSLHLGELEDATEDAESPDLEVLDTPNITMELTYLDGIRRKKAVSADLSIELYNLFLSYFRKSVA